MASEHTHTTQMKERVMRAKKSPSLERLNRA
jgi:hypothetical protein